MDSLTNMMLNYVLKQCEYHFPDGITPDKTEAHSIISQGLSELKTCFSYLRDPYFSGDFLKTFNYLNGDHYSMFLYKISHISFLKFNNVNFSEKLFQLNRSLHGIDAFYKIKLPPVFQFAHPLGTILGGAEFGNFFCVHQGCTIGNKEAGGYPSFGEGVILFSGASIIGKSKIGNNVVFGAGSRQIDGNVADNTLVLGQHPDNKYIDVNMEYFEKLFIR